MNTDSIGDLIQNILYHMRSIEVRMEWATCHFKNSDKHRINLSILKVKNAINEISFLCKDPDIIFQIKKELDKTDVVYFMTLTEQLFNLKEEYLREITDLIDKYLIEKFESTERESFQLKESTA